VIDNASTVDFGSITKIEIFYDLVNSPSVSSVYYKDLDQIPADGKFYHSYGTFNSPVSKNYEIRMIASSGASCISVPADQTITVNANPVVTVSTIGAVCQGSAAVQISTNSNGFAGTGVFSGTGVSSTGLFDPSASGAFTISYLFTDQSGCTFASSQVVTVNAAPSISIPSTYTILAGGQTKLEATANGDSLTYRWSPSTGLSDSTILDPVASPLTDTKYTLTATAITGCTAVATVEVHVLQSPVIPNTFTPNGDGINDTWAIQYLDSYPGCAVSIYNRYGTRLFYSVGYPNAWDGRYNGVVVPSGAYYYIIDPKHGRAVISGCVMIIR
jgi:gliding motility-associated-like protein